MTLKTAEVSIHKLLSSYNFPNSFYLKFSAAAVKVVLSYDKRVPPECKKFVGTGIKVCLDINVTLKELVELMVALETDVIHTSLVMHVVKRIIATIKYKNCDIGLACYTTDYALAVANDCSVFFRYRNINKFFKLLEEEFNKLLAEYTEAELLLMKRVI